MSLSIRKRLAKIFRERGWIDLYLKTLKTGLFINKKSVVLKDLISLNKRFYWKTLSYERKINQYEAPSFYPVIYIADVIEDIDNVHYFFHPDFKELMIEGLINTFKVNVKEIKQNQISRISKKNRLLLRLRFYENQRKVEIQAELVNLKSGNIFKTYTIRQYGNRKLLKAVIALSSKIAKDVIPFGKILSIDDDQAIINLGKLQNVKKNDRFFILKNQVVIDQFFSGSMFKKPQVIGEAVVLRVDEKIALVRLHKNRRVVFDLINVNDIVMVKKTDVKKKKKN